MKQWKISLVEVLPDPNNFGNIVRGVCHNGSVSVATVMDIGDSFYWAFKFDVRTMSELKEKIVDADYQVRRKIIETFKKVPDIVWGETIDFLAREVKKNGYL